MKRIDQPTGQYKINLNPNPNTYTKFVIIYVVINAGPFFSFDPLWVIESIYVGMHGWLGSSCLL